MKFSPRPYQTLITDYILDNSRCAIWSSMGTGKSVATLNAISTLLLVEDGPALVVAPLRVARSTWPDEARKWDHLDALRVVPIVGSVSVRRQALEREAEVYTTNYENLPWLIEHWGERWPYRIVVLDESTKVKGFRTRQGGKRAKQLAKVAHTKIKRLIELTGTPASNGLKDLWGQLWFVDSGARLGKSFTAFSQRWFQKDFTGFNISPMAHAQTEIQDRLRDVCLTVEAKDYFDLKKPIVNNIYVDLPTPVRKHYLDMEKHMFMSLESGHEVEAFNAASKTMKCLQITNGAAYVGESNTEWKELHDEKLQALESIVEEAAGAPVLVAYHFKSDLARLQKRFPQGRVLDAKSRTIQEWNAGEIPVLFAHPQSAGHGLNLQDGGNILVYFAHWWNSEERDQILERIGPTRQMQAGHDRPVFVHNIIVRDSVDELVMERLETKREVQAILMDAMKRRKLC